MRAALASRHLAPAAALESLTSHGFEVLGARRSATTILDTFDGRLHAAGLRLALDGGPPVALVLSGSGEAPASLDRPCAPQWPDDLPPGPFRERIAAVTRERALLPLLTLRSLVREARLLDRRGKTVVRVLVHSDIDVGAPTPEGVPTWVAEIQPTAGHQHEAVATEALLAAAGLERLTGDAAEVIGALTGSPLSGFDSSPTVPLDPGDDALGAFRQVLLKLAGTIEANLPGTVDDIDPEFLHDLRVAVRRTRSVLAEGRHVLSDDIRRHYRKEFGWLGQVTGPPRDLDVYLLGWEAYVAPLQPPDRFTLEEVRRALERRRRIAHRDLSEALASDRATDLLASWQAWLLDPGADAPPQTIGAVVARRIAAAQRTVLRDGRRITPETAAERLHDLRKDTKKLRYLLECFGGLLPASARRRFVSPLKALQDNLGEHQDAEVHLHELRELAHDLRTDPRVDADVLLAMGRLSDHLERRRRKERDAFAARFAAYDTKANRRTLGDLLREVDPG